MVLVILFGGVSTTATASPAAYVVPLKTSYALSSHHGLPVITVSVGRDHSVNLLFDTGSVGMRIFAKDLPTGPSSGITVSTAPR